jgi:hypothetical protein
MAATLRREAEERRIVTVQTRVRLVFGVLVLALASSVAASSFADLQAWSAAMGCCANTHYACTGTSSPDHRCRRMNHTPPRAAAGMLSSAMLRSAPIALISRPFAIALDTRTGVLRLPEPLPRPHDPPHRHTYSLLI